MNPTTSGIDQLIVKLVGELTDPLMLAVGGLGFVVGLWHIGMAFKRLYQKFGQERHDIPDASIWSRLIVGGLLINVFSAIGMSGSTFFGGEADITFSGLSYQATDSALQARAESAVAAVLTIVQIVGIIAFFNGLLMFIHEADGKPSGGPASKWIHLIGGILGAYITPVLLAIQTTLGLAIIK